MIRVIFYKDLEKRRELVRNYIQEHPFATFSEIKRILHTKINKVYSGGMEEAYVNAGVRPPRTFKRMTPEQKKGIIIDYIKNNPLAGGQSIRQDTKINYLSIFKSTKEVFEAAGINYPRDDRRNLLLRQKVDRREHIIRLVRKNPSITIDQISRMIRVHPYRIFKNTKEIYDAAGIRFLSGGIKRRLKKKRLVINFIKNNPFATQREINSFCKTHVQSIFNDGIFEAYKYAGVDFPYKRLNQHGAALREIKTEARLFEEKIARNLSCYGCVNRLVKTKRGFADLVLERNSKKAVLETKNYRSHEISISQIKQLNKYLEDMRCRLGFIVCLKKPKKDMFLIGKNKILVLEDSELSKVPRIIDEGL